jgi:hypothetical protein
MGQTGTTENVNIRVIGASTRFKGDKTIYQRILDEKKKEKNAK